MLELVMVTLSINIHYMDDWVYKGNSRHQSSAVVVTQELVLYLLEHTFKISLSVLSRSTHIYSLVFTVIMCMAVFRKLLQVCTNLTTNTTAVDLLFVMTPDMSCHIITSGKQSPANITGIRFGPCMKTHLTLQVS